MLMLKLKYFVVHLLCVGADVLSHTSPALPTDSNFDTLFKQFSTFLFSSEEVSGQTTTDQPQDSSGYQASLCFEEVTVTLFSVSLELFIHNDLPLIKEESAHPLLMVSGFSMGM